MSTSTSQYHQTGTDIFGDEAKSLKFELAKQGRDLKSAKSQAASARAKAELATQKQEQSELRLNDQYKSRFEELEEEVERFNKEQKSTKNELKAVQGEYQKATLDLRKERELSANIIREKRDLGQKLHAESSNSGNLQKEIETLKRKGKQQTEVINSWRTRDHDTTTKSKALERDLQAAREQLAGKTEIASEIPSGNVALQGRVNSGQTL